ncbi:glycosyltransferase family 4 protein [Nesterenkonia sphaerica]|uniref:D-inositol 3-phosphate glycosyltransferase n=1 Tax=Nesterenkonia sphaerica TaxID=1804988 RepID=A0A5R9A5V2_9MICC|nr:glycosyltransferase family 1 protein [Nesterenkonia sphaerica]TLP74089.1 glycosyltransferase family 1 protein [Nesterenkonia sphaerica]
MKVAVVAESFLPHVNGVSNSVLKVLTHLRRRGDSATVIAPSASAFGTRTVVTPEAPTGETCSGFPVIRVPSLPLPDYPTVRVAAGTSTRLRLLLEQMQPDVVHVASPFILGWRAIQAARTLGLPTVSVYQTEVPTFAARYRARWAEPLLWQHVERMHSASTINLVPSSFCHNQLRERGVPRLKIWRRGVDSDLFTPTRRSALLRRTWAPHGEKIIGFVGRLAAEKQVTDLTALDGIPGTRLVIVGAGPEEGALRRHLPHAHFAGFQSNEDLATHMASLDVLVHPGEAETFCQTIQEAFASAVPVVAVGRGGPVDLVDPGRTGWLYQPGDVTGMRAAVEHLVFNEEARSRAASHAHREVQGRTWESVANQLIGHYARAVEINSRIQAHAPTMTLLSRRAGLS